VTDLLEERMDAIADLTYAGDWRDVRRRARRGGRSATSLVAAAMVGAAIVAAPSLAFRANVRELVGLRNPPSTSAAAGWHRPILVATVKSVIVHTPAPRYGPPLVTITFTIGEEGKAPGTGVTFGSYFLVNLIPRAPGAASPSLLPRGYGTRGHYRVTARLPQGGLASIQIGGFINVRKGPSAANGTFWIPVRYAARLSGQ
jgi:hypothetical protein